MSNHLVIFFFEGISFLLPDSYFPASYAIPALKSCELSKEDVKLHVEVLLALGLRRSIAGTLVMLPAILDPTILGYLGCAFLISTEDVGDDFTVIERSGVALPHILASRVFFFGIDFRCFLHAFIVSRRESLVIDVAIIFDFSTYRISPRVIDE